MQSITESPFESYSQFVHAVTFSGKHSKDKYDEDQPK